jgi:hypothetical protein
VLDGLDTKAAAPAGAPPIEVIPTDWNEGAICLRLSGPVEHWIVVKLDLERERVDAGMRPRASFDTGAVRAGPLRTDAHFAHVWKRGTRVGYSATLPTRLSWEDRVLLDVPRNTFGLQLDGSPDRESQARWRRWEQEEA